LIDGLHFRDHVILLALGVDAQGTKHVLALREGTTENATVCKGLLANLRQRGLDLDRPALFIIDGGTGCGRRSATPASRSPSSNAARSTSGATSWSISPRHCARASAASSMKRTASPMRPWRNAASCKVQLAAGLEQTHPGAAASLREGLDETLTLQRLGVTGALYRTLRSTNAIENLNGLVGRFVRNVRRWRDGRMLVRWIAAGLHEARRGFRRVRSRRAHCPHPHARTENAGHREGGRIDAHSSSRRSGAFNSERDIPLLLSATC
jgi:putative transposase